MSSQVMVSSAAPLATVPDGKLSVS